MDKKDTIEFPLSKTDAILLNIELYKKFVEELKEQLAKEDIGTDKYNKLHDKIESTQEILDKLIKDAEAIDTIGLTEKLKKINSDVGDVVKEVGNFESSLKLFEVEDEKFNDILEKVEDILEKAKESVSIIDSILIVDKDRTLEDELEKINKEIEKQAKLISTAESTEEKIKALEKYNEAVAKSDEIQKKIAERDKKRQQDKVEAYKQASDRITAMLSENTLAHKTAALASATIDAYKGASSALASDAIGPARWVAFSAALATGLANVKSILRIHVPGESGGAGSAPAGSGETATASAPVLPQLEDAIQETHNNMSAADENFFNQQPSQKVYVLESDISGVQHKVKAAETETTF